MVCNQLPLLVILATLVIATVNVYRHRDTMAIGGEHPINRTTIFPGAGICLPLY